jgi:predicted regulator of Ras-like GTPase activity (Roadblock/LC7/MglB family)
MGEVFLGAGFPAKAESEWREALRLDPTHPRAHLRLGELHLSRGERKQAVAAFGAALLHSPGFAEAQKGLEEARRGERRLRGEGRLPGGMAVEESEGEEAVRRWQPGERPAWLTSDRTEDLVKAVSGCRSVKAAALVSIVGQELAPALRDEGAPSGAKVACRGKVEGSAGAAAELVVEARDLMRRLGAGRLRAALVCGEGGSLRCVALGDLTLAVTLEPGASGGAAELEIEEAVEGLRRRDRSESVAGG